MKKTLYLYILWISSLLATVSRVFQSFFSALKTLDLTSTGDKAADAMLETANQVAKAQHTYETSLGIRTLVILMVLALLASLVFLVGKDLKALYCYGVYLVLTVVEKILDFFQAHHLLTLYRDSDMRQTAQAAGTFALGLSFLVFLIYVAVIFINLRADKRKDQSQQVGMDI